VDWVAFVLMLAMGFWSYHLGAQLFIPDHMGLYVALSLWVLVLQLGFLISWMRTSPGVAGSAGKVSTEDKEIEEWFQQASVSPPSSPSVEEQYQEQRQRQRPPPIPPASPPTSKK
jgi:hypothetical protein